MKLCDTIHVHDTMHIPPKFCTKMIHGTLAFLSMMGVLPSSPWLHFQNESVSLEWERPMPTSVGTQNTSCLGLGLSERVSQSVNMSVNICKQSVNMPVNSL